VLQNRYRYKYLSNPDGQIDSGLDDVAGRNNTSGNTDSHRDRENRSPDPTVWKERGSGQGACFRTPRTFGLVKDEEKILP
jgi:hypothetical protein